MGAVRENVPLAPLTTLGIGGPAEYFVEVETKEEVRDAFTFAKERNLPLTVIGGGSNLLVADAGIPGLVVRMRIKGIEIYGERVRVAAGEDLAELVRRAIGEELGGLETLTDIPGTVGGAIYGNAGAYGRTISDFLTRVTVFNGKGLRTLSKDECGFCYRGSIMKGRPWAIVEAEFSLLKLHKRMLESIGQAISAHRAIRYPKGLKIPGSFFKNADVKEVPPEALEKIPAYGIMGNKIQAGFLLELVGALGARHGSVKVSEHHGNLFINEGGAAAEEFLSLAEEYWRRVHERFGITLEPEVELLGFKKKYFTRSL